MKLKTLFIVVALLAIASVAVYFVRRPAPPASADPRVGNPLLASDAAEKAAGFRLTDAGNTVELAKNPDGTWRVVSFHDLPADFGKLSRFVKDLTDAKIERLVTSNPETIARLGFSDTTLRLLGESGEPIWSITLGRTAEGGGRFVRFGDESKAYRARLSAWLDSTARNWADSALVGVKPEQVAKVEIGFLPGEGEPVVATREKAEEPFKSPGTPENQQLRQSTLNSLLSTLTTLRFIDTSAPDDPEAIAARQHQRSVTLTTFDGASVTIALGRKPEQTVVKAPEAEPAKSGSDTGADTMPGGESGNESSDNDGDHGDQSTTETIPAGPVFAVIGGDPKLARLAAASDRVAFKISEYNFTSLPKTPGELFEAVPAATSAESSQPPRSSPPAEASQPMPPAP